MGLAGNDVLNGGPGNDKLVGGKGADKLRCGAGKDTAVADETDTVGADCEVVKGLPPKRRPLLPPPPAPSSPAAPHTGKWSLLRIHESGQEHLLRRHPDGVRAANFATTSDVTCGNVGINGLGLSFSGSTPIQADLTFSYTYNGAFRPVAAPH